MEFKLEEKESNMETQKPIETQVAEWSATESVLREAVKATEGVTVAAHVEGPKKGRDAVHAAMMTLSAHRVSIEKRRTELKAPILSLGKLVDSEAKRLTAITEGRENELRTDRDAYDAEQAKIAAAKKAEEDRIEAEAAKARAEALQARVDKVSALGGIPNLALLAAMSEDAFAEQIAVLESAKAEREAAEKLAAKQKAEADRIEAERIAAERKAQAEADEAKRKADAAEAAERARLQKIEDDRRAAEQAEIDKARAELEAERVRLAKAKEEADAAEAERIQRIQREAEEKAEAERIAEQKREQEREAAEAEQRREEEEKAEVARIMAEKPDRELLGDWARSILKNFPALPSVDSDSLHEEASEVRSNVMNQLTAFAEEMAVI